MVSRRKAKKEVLNVCNNKLPHQAAESSADWPVTEPDEFRRLVFDNAAEGPWEEVVGEPFFENADAAQIARADQKSHLMWLGGKYTVGIMLDNSRQYRGEADEVAP
jgi:hypothetical protein